MVVRVAKKVVRKKQSSLSVCDLPPVRPRQMRPHITYNRCLLQFTERGKLKLAFRLDNNSRRDSSTTHTHTPQNEGGET